jgi:predicted SprT family Zn-dependent metalloprotease
MTEITNAHWRRCFDKFNELKTFFPAIKDRLDVDLYFRTDMFKVAGLAYRRQVRIDLNAQMFIANEEEFMARTIPHEFAHLVNFILNPKAKQAHGPEFRSILATMGASHKRGHAYDWSVATPGQSYKYACACAEVRYLGRIVHKRLQSEPRTCPSCKKKMIFVQDSVYNTTLSLTT